MNRPTLALSLLATVFLGSCGKAHYEKTTDSSAVSASVSSPTNSNNGNCGAAVVTEYNNLNNVCDPNHPRHDEEGCHRCASEFLRKYPTASCDIVVPNSDDDSRRRHRDHDDRDWHPQRRDHDDRHFQVIGSIKASEIRGRENRRNDSSHR